MIKKMVLGFLFDLQLNYVVLIKKNRPDFLRGKLNGVGGKIKNGETSHQAMCREFEEECGFSIDKWEYLITFSGRDYSYSVKCYCQFDPKITLAKTCTDEKVDIFRVDMLHMHPLDSTARWILFLAIDFLKGKSHPRINR